MNSYLIDVQEHSGSVVECLIRDWRAAGSGLTGFTIVLTNSTFGLFYSNFLILTPTFSKVPIEKYGKTPIFSGKQHFYSYFQNPSENFGHCVVVLEQDTFILA